MRLVVACGVKPVLLMHSMHFAIGETEHWYINAGRIGDLLPLSRAPWTAC